MDLIGIAAAADSPAALPGVEEAARRLASEGGMLGALLVLALTAIGVMWFEMRRRQASAETTREAQQKQHDAEREEWQRQIKELHEKRFASMREVMDALSSNTAAFTVVSSTQADRAASTRDMAELLREVLLIARTNSETLKSVATGINANGQAIERLTWHGGVARAASPAGGAS